MAHVVDLKLQCRQALNESIEDQSQWFKDQDHQPKSTGQNVTSQLINFFFFFFFFFFFNLFIFIIFTEQTHTLLTILILYLHPFTYTLHYSYLQFLYKQAGQTLTLLTILAI